MSVSKVRLFCDQAHEVPEQLMLAVYRFATVTAIAIVTVVSLGEKLAAHGQT